MNHQLIRRAGSVIVIVAVAVSLAPHTLAQAGGKKPQRPTLHFRVPVPVDIRQVWSESLVVATFRVESELPIVEPIPGAKSRSEWTLYRVRVLRVFKGAEIVSEKETDHLLPIMRIGCKSGDPDYDAVLDDGFAPFGKGEEYFAFLGILPAPHENSMYIKYMGVGVYQLKDGRVNPRSDEPISMRQRGRKADAFLKELEDLARNEVRKH